MLLKILSWNRAGIKFLARLLVALFQFQTVNLAKIFSVFTGNVKVASLLWAEILHNFFNEDVLVESQKIYFQFLLTILNWATVSDPF